MMRCPICHVPFVRPLPRDGRTPCTRCGASIVTDDVAVDVIPGRAAPSSWGARAMASRWLASAYDRVWRPALFALTTGFGAPAREVEARVVLDALGTGGGPWLDLSCGTGWLTRRLVDVALREGRGRAVFGVDSSRAMLSRAREKTRGALLVRADAAALPFEDGVFAGVANLAALDLYIDPARVVLESARVLSPGGRWIASSFLRPGGYAARGALSGVRTPSLDELARWAAAAGLAGFGHRVFRRYVVAWADKP